MRITCLRRHGLLVMMLFCLATLVLAGCQQPTTNAKPVSVSPEAPAPKEPAPKPASEWREVFPAERFEDWKDARPEGWGARLAKKADKGRTGAGVELLPDAKTYPAVFRTLPDDLAGKTLQVSAQGKTNEAGKLVLALRFKVGGEQKAHWVAHSGNGKWEKLSLTRTLPDEVDAGSLKIRCTLRPAAQGSAFVDDVSCRVKVN